MGIDDFDLIGRFYDALLALRNLQGVLSEKTLHITVPILQPPNKGMYVSTRYQCLQRNKLKCIKFVINKLSI